MTTDNKITVENVNTPGKTSRVDRAKYDAMKAAMTATMPNTAPGATAAQIKQAALPHLPDTLFPGGATAGWWQKTVQLDLEAKGQITRSPTKPLRFFLT